MTDLEWTTFTGHLGASQWRYHPKSKSQLICFITQLLHYLTYCLPNSEAGVFWGLHSIHHSSEYYNLSTALRQAGIQDAGLAVYDVLQVSPLPLLLF